MREHEVSIAVVETRGILKLMVWHELPRSPSKLTEAVLSARPRALYPR
jgi:hypothetical protein